MLLAGISSCPSPSVPLWVYVPAHSILDTWKIIACYFIKLYTEATWWLFSVLWIKIPRGSGSCHWLDFTPIEVLLKKLNSTEHSLLFPFVVCFADYYFTIYARGFICLTSVRVARMLETEGGWTIFGPAFSELNREDLVGKAGFCVYLQCPSAYRFPLFWVCLLAAETWGCQNLSHIPRVCFSGYFMLPHLCISMSSSCLLVPISTINI